MTHEEWLSQPEMAKALYREMQTPLWQSVMSVLESLSYARRYNSTPAHIIVAAGIAMQAQTTGYERALSNLRDLADTTPRKPKQKVVEDYGTDPNNPTD